MAQIAQPFRVAAGLWVTPDFIAALAGDIVPPRVDHSRIQFLSLCEALKQLFPYGPPVRIRVPNDTIDQVTVHVRNGLPLPGWEDAPPPSGSIRCEDFGEAMLDCAAHQDGDVLDVLKTWRDLHCLPNRLFAPPPVLLPFVVEAADMEDAMIWEASAKQSLGMPFLPPDIQALVGEPSLEGGRLPLKFCEVLEAVFGAKYATPALLDRMAMGPIPHGMLA